MLFRQFISAGWIVGRWLALPAVALNLAASAGVHAQTAGAGVQVGGPPAPGTTSTHIFLDGPPLRGLLAITTKQQVKSAKVSR